MHRWQTELPSNRLPCPGRKLHPPDNCVTDFRKPQPNSIVLGKQQSTAYTPLQIAPWNQAGALEPQSDGRVVAATEPL
jgi:hypothetical protein